MHAERFINRNMGPGKRLINVGQSSGLIIILNHQGMSGNNHLQSCLSEEYDTLAQYNY